MALRIHWGAAVAVFYTAFALSTVGFVVFAMSRDVELVSDDYYARALKHDGHMQAVANGAALGTAVGATVADGHVMVRVPQVMASLVRGTVTLYRPADAQADRTVALVPAPDGTMLVPTAGLASGRWLVQMRWSAGDRDYYAERDIRLP